METEVACSRQRRDDLEVVVRYVKEVLFERVKFIYDPKEDLAVNGKIYKDYRIRCKDQLGSHLPLLHWEMHLKGVWTDALTKHMQKNALAAKRSAVYTVTALWEPYTGYWSQWLAQPFVDA